MPRFAQHMEGIAPFHVMRLLGEAQAMQQQGIDVCHMEVGEPDFPTAACILKAGQRALEQGFTHYTPSLGLAELRESIAHWYERRFSLAVSPRRVVVTPGASGAIQLLLSLFLDPGDEVLLTDPGYPCNRHMAMLLVAEPRMLPVEAVNNFQPTPEQIRAAWVEGKTQLLLLASPANPTGSVIDKEPLEEIHQTVRELGGVLVVDEIYQGLNYGKASFSALELGEDVFVINSFSKYFGMTGWRVGWLVAAEEAVEPLERLAQNLFLAAATPSQHAAIEALSEAAVVVHEERRDIFQQRRDFLAPALEELGFGFAGGSDGAFYLYADASSLLREGEDALQLSTRLLHDAHVAVTPGIDFGSHRARSHIRFAYTQPIDCLESGVERLARQLLTRTEK